MHPIYFTEYKNNFTMENRCIWNWKIRWTISVFTLFVYLALVNVVSVRDVKPQEELYLPDYSIYHNYSLIESHVSNMISKYSQFIRVDWSYQSRQNRKQIVIQVTDFQNTLSLHNKNHNSNYVPIKQKVLFSYGEHAREFFPVETMFVFLEFVLEGLSSKSETSHTEFSKTLLTRFELYIIVMANPDGRIYLEKTKNYCWRGTSTGVDLNRNFDWQFGNVGSSSNHDDEEFRGKQAFSEPECLVFRELTTEHSFDLFISFHSGIRQIYIPFADTRSKQKHQIPVNYYSMLDLAEKMAKSTRFDYKYGEAYKLNDYTADGTIFDYMAGVRKIPFSFAIELWGEGDHPGARCFDLFNPKSEQLQDIASAIIPLYQTIFHYLLTWKESRNKKAYHIPDPISPDTLKVGQFMLLGVVVATCYFAVHRYLPSCLQCFPRRRIISLRNLSSSFKLSLAGLKST